LRYFHIRAAPTGAACLVFRIKQRNTNLARVCTRSGCLRLGICQSPPPHPRGVWSQSKKFFGLFGISRPAWPKYQGMARNNIEYGSEVIYVTVNVRIVLSTRQSPSSSVVASRGSDGCICKTDRLFKESRSEVHKAG